MNLDKLYQILGETTAQFRKGEEITREVRGTIGVTHVYMMPPESEIADNIEKVDLHFITIGVDKAKAEARRQDLIDILATYPDPEELAGGPSYMRVGGAIGDQGAAFQLFALGKVLGLWSVITPATFGMTGAEADQAAGLGYIMISGYRAGQPA